MMINFSFELQLTTSHHFLRISNLESQYRHCAQQFPFENSKLKHEHYLYLFLSFTRRRPRPHGPLGDRAVLPAVLPLQGHPQEGGGEGEAVDAQLARSRTRRVHSAHKVSYT